MVFHTLCHFLTVPSMVSTTHLYEQQDFNLRMPDYFLRPCTTCTGRTDSIGATESPLPTSAAAEEAVQALKINIKIKIKRTTMVQFKELNLFWVDRYVLGFNFNPKFVAIIPDYPREENVLLLPTCSSWLYL